MKRLFNYIPVLFFLLMQVLVSLCVKAQDSTKKDQQDSVKKDLIVNIGYYDLNNEWAYLSVHAKAKLEGKFKPVGGARLRLYLDKDSAACIAGNLITDEKGDAFTTLKPSLKDQWNSTPAHTFIAVYDGDATYNPSRTEAAVARARLNIDTGAGRTISVSMVEYKNGEWVPAKGVEIKVAVKRSGSDLAAGEKESYTTDSTGKMEVEFKRDGLPGNKKGFLTLVAKVEDNDTYGNLRLEKEVPWGSVVRINNSFDERALWAARFKTPIWLLLMEYFIFLSVWGVLIYLLFQGVKIKRAGMAVRE